MSIQITNHLICSIMYDMIKICCLLLNYVFVNFYFDQHFLPLNNAFVITEFIYF